MARMFVAAQFSADVVADLLRLRPDPAPGVRRVEADQMHVTVHFLGDVDEQRMATALEAVRTPAFTLMLRGVGSFPSAGGDLTLWAGIEPCEGLTALHSALALALAPEGFVPETRPYRPHITLARLKPDVPAAVVDAFSARGSGFSATTTIDSFGLYASTFVDGAPVYTCARSFPLGDAKPA